MRYLIFTLALITNVISCVTKKEKCDIFNFDSKSFFGDSIRLKFYKSCTNIDSTFYHNRSLRFSRIVFSEDRSNLIIVNVNDYSVYPVWDDTFE